MTLSYTTYHNKLRSCFLGKTVGGTLGMPYEGSLDTRAVTFYDPVPTRMVPNDDLDLQVVNLETLLRYGFPVNRRHLGDLWRRHILDFPDEYGVAQHNTLAGLYAPLSGRYNNKFHGGMGAAIRSELWACLAPGDPNLAAALAREDACTDHTEDGIDAAMFLAAVESLAFVERDLAALVHTGMSCISPEGRLYRALQSVLDWWDQSLDTLKIRELILSTYPSDNWTDVSINLAFILLAWLAGEQDFSKAICTAAGLGYDTDCTCATLGAIMGILYPDGIERRWLEPIGEDLVLSDCIVGIHEPNSISSFCEIIASLCPQTLRYYHSFMQLADIPETAQKVSLPAPWSPSPCVIEWDRDSAESLVALSPLAILLQYPSTVALQPNVPGDFTVKLRNSSPSAFDGTLCLRVPLGWKITPSTFSLHIRPLEEVTLPVVITPGPCTKRRPNYNPILFVLERSDGFRWQEEAGLVLTIPWMRKAESSNDWEAIEAAQNFQIVPRGAYHYRTAVKFPSGKGLCRMTVQGTRKLTASLNGTPILSHDGLVYVPAFHRSAPVAAFTMKSGWNILDIAVEDGDAGEIFVGFASIAGCGEWINGCEWSTAPLEVDGV